MRSTVRNNSVSGFTLVEVMVIAPIVILVIGAFVGLMVTLTGDVLRSKESNTLIYTTQDAMDRFEQDARLATNFLTTSYTPLSPQGLNNTATPLSQPSAVIFQTQATTKNPLDSSRQLVYVANAPYPCTDSRVTQNTPYTINVAYFYTADPTNGEYIMWRRTLFDKDYNPANVCGTVWQQPSCQVGQTAAICKANDVEVLRNVTSFIASYYANAYDTVLATDSSTAKTIQLNVNTKETIAGKDISYSAAVRATRINTTGNQ